MRNIDRLAKYVTKHGSESILIHTIPGTSSWIICQKIELNKWLVTMANPMGYVTYNLGTVSDNQHLQLWMELIKMEIEKKTSQVLAARELKNKIHQFLKTYDKNEKTNKNKKYKRIK